MMADKKFPRYDEKVIRARIGDKHWSSVLTFSDNGSLMRYSDHEKFRTEIFNRIAAVAARARLERGIVAGGGDYDVALHIIENDLIAILDARDNWQPIETAPQDGGEILVHDITSNTQYIAWFEAGNWLYASDRMGYPIHCIPTHWMPKIPGPATT
jgi:hypothetical protein